MDASPFALLERVELAARERILGAASEAEAIAAESRRQCAEIENAIPSRIDAAIAALREEHRRRAAAEIAAVEASVGRTTMPAADGRTPTTNADLGPAIALIVAAVLGEDR